MTAVAQRLRMALPAAVPIVGIALQIDDATLRQIRPPGLGFSAQGGANGSD
jgi:hypothetical protein